MQKIIKMNSRSIFPYLLVMPAIVICSIFIYYPLIGNFVISFYYWDIIGQVSRRFIGLNNYKRLFSDPIFWIAMKNNLYYVFLSVVVQVGGGLLLATLIESLSRRGSRVFRSIIAIPMVISMVAVALLWTFIYHPVYGVLNKFLNTIGLESLTRVWLGDSKVTIFAIIAISCWQWTSFCILLFCAGLQTIPPAIYEAAKIDGAKSLDCFRHITLPLLKNVSITVIVFTVITSFTVFTVVFATTYGGPNHASEVVMMYVYTVGLRGGRMGYAGSLVTVFYIFIFTIAVIQLKLFKLGKG
ncbi:sugar ABC transporter permease [Candidatus Aerophobetes bacterium]|nr:sugar ABC transporter permease [Candidatus Aerophobetes bacterium]